MRRELPTLGVAIAVAILIYIFGTLVFLPLAAGISLLGQYPLDTIIGVIILIALLAVIFWALRSIIRLSDGLSQYFAAEIGMRRPENLDENSVRRIGSFLRAIILVIVMVLVFLLLLPYFNLITPVLAGVVLLAIVLASVWLLWRGGTRISGEMTKMMEGAGTKASRMFRGETTKPEERIPPGQRQTPA